MRHKLSKEGTSQQFQFPVYSSESTNNGIVGYTDNPEFICNEQTPIYITFGDHTRTFNVVKKSFSVLDNVKVLIPCTNSIMALLFITTIWQKQIPSLGYSRHWKKAKNSILQLPVNAKGKLDFAFMEDFVHDIGKVHMSELEGQIQHELDAYLHATGLTNHELAPSEKSALKKLPNLCWQSFNVQELFGESTRGKRLKGADRNPGSLPFVTAGEVNTGISAFIGNKVKIFQRNTTTIDMFGSAKYRNYEYGADDHVAVVHTEDLPPLAAIFVAAACHKASHTGEFNYGHNFYAKDADELNIMLPAKNSVPDIKTMEAIIRAAQKLVINDVVTAANRRLTAMEKIVNR